VNVLLNESSARIPTTTPSKNAHKEIQMQAKLAVELDARRCRSNHLFGVLRVGAAQKISPISSSRPAISTVMA